MQKLTFFLIVVGVVVSGTEASSVRDGNKAKFLQLILGRVETKDGFHVPEARYKRQAYIITDDPGPIMISGVLDGHLAVEESDLISIVGVVSGRLANGRSSVDFRKITDGSFPIAVEGKFHGTVHFDDIDPSPDASMTEAKVELTVELETNRQRFSVTGHLSGNLKIDTSQEALHAIVDEPEPFGIHGKISGDLIFPTGWKKIGIADHGK